MANTPRTTDALVQAVLLPGKDYDTDRSPSLTRFIKAASLIVDRVATCATAKGLTLTSEELAEVETWLAAHMYMMSDQQQSSGANGGASGSYRAAGGLNLDGSTYGQAARAIDYSGCLDAIGKRAFAGGFWGGKPPSSQIDYVDRD